MSNIQKESFADELEREFKEADETLVKTVQDSLIPRSEAQARIVEGFRKADKKIAGLEAELKQLEAGKGVTT